jgi:hypothetical protein
MMDQQERDYRAAEKARKAAQIALETYGSNSPIVTRMAAKARALELAYGENWSDSHAGGSSR